MDLSSAAVLKLFGISLPVVSSRRARAGGDGPESSQAKTLAVRSEDGTEETYRLTDSAARDAAPAYPFHCTNRCPLMQHPDSFGCAAFSLSRLVEH
jgi:hypothetical protein